jgi:two-component system response regulator VicR
MNRIAKNILNAVEKTKKEVFTQSEIFELVNKVASSNTVKLIKCGDLIMKRNNLSVEVNGKTTILTKTNFELLAYLVENKNETIERDILIRDVWGKDIPTDSRTIDVSICNLRNVIGKNRIKNIKKVGYSYVELNE